MIEPQYGTYGNSYGYAPGYDATGTYGADTAGAGAGGESSFFDDLLARVQGYAARVNDGMAIPLGIGVGAAALTYFLGDHFDVVDGLIQAASTGIVVAGAVKIVAAFITDGFEAFSSNSLWWGAGVLTAGVATPWLSNYVLSKIGGEGEGLAF